ncbi:MAG TPA: phosphatase PAP2 family protein [Candidatus Acidoferrales bacterium]|nr:phosphatase PAP2 family protein [Candidatus Acidoferrales bacterium]
MRQSRHQWCQRFASLLFGVLAAAIFAQPALHAQESSIFKHVTLVQNSSPTLDLQMPPPSPSFSPPEPWSAPLETSRPFSESSSDSGALLQARAVPPQRDVSWKLLPKNFLEDQKDMWITFPDHLLFHGQHWLPTFSIIAVEGGLIEADPYDTPWFRQTNNFPNFNRYFSKVNTDAFLAVGPGTVYLVGLWRKDTFAQKTAIFSGEAAADAMVFYAIAQEATHRSRPIEIPPHGDFGDTFYDGHHGLISNSFPSGHAAEAFAIATVFERRYRDHKWVPWVAYGVATLIGFSRITLQSHFPSDVFMGSAIGYTVGRYVALQGQ